NYDDFLEKIGWDDEPKAKKKEDKGKKPEKQAELEEAPKPSKPAKKRDRGFA
ncbi:MAG: hypothetical protein HQK85_08640, partial [Nitrospinae bacterium]|nr:hypothetical protein [Nitrospinota bacterium]